MLQTWQLEEAKSKLSRVIKAAIQQGPQIITRRGTEVAIVISIDEYRGMTANRGKLSEFLAQSPAAGIDLDLTRDRSGGRQDIELPGACPTRAVETWSTKRLPVAPDEVAPDGSDVRVLLRLPRGSMAHFELAPGQTSFAVALRTVKEIWFFLTGHGEMWRKCGEREETVKVEPGVCLTIPQGTHFQFRSLAGGQEGDEPLAAVGVTMPPWTGQGQVCRVTGPWTPTVEA
jgi:prevent-host-death family protein